MTWKRCSTCKKSIDLDAEYYVCSVSTCNRADAKFRFCSVECWDAHLPVMRHRDAWAVTEHSPRTNEPEPPVRKPPPPPPAARAPQPAPPPGSAPLRPVEKATMPYTPPPTRPADPGEIVLSDEDVPSDVLVVVSKVKAYIRARSGMNTSEGVTRPLSDLVREACDDAIQTAARSGRKTVLDRDFE